jgi:hypothetical protein
MLLDGHVLAMGDKAAVWGHADPRVQAFLGRRAPAVASRDDQLSGLITI